MNHPIRVSAIALLLILAGGVLAWRTQTAGGTVAVRDVRWVSPSGTGMSGLLYVPEGVSAAAPAPGVVAVHGYINSRETQAGFAIEFARRGYVVLSIDQTGHGYSDPPAFAGGFGGPAALAYLRTLDFVARDNIGLEGHSMGGWASGMAATAMPDGYKAMILAGSSTGSSGVQDGTPEWPRNVAVIFSIWDEFSPTMWGTPVAADIGKTPKLMELFGTEAEVEPGVVYGSIDDGTARILYQPRTNHPGDHLSSEAIGNAVEWFGRTLEGGQALPPSDQIWIWKEVGSLIAAIGMVLLLFPVGILLLGTRFFGEIHTEAAPYPNQGRGWWIAAAITAFLGPLTFFRFKGLPGTIGWSASELFPQSITNGVVAWTTALALITLAVLVVGHLATSRDRRRTADDYGLTWNRRLSPVRLGKSLLLAALIVSAGYATLVVTDFLFLTDYRFWVFAIKPMSALQFRIALVYFVPFALYFLILSIVLRGLLARGGWSGAKEMFANLAILTIGYVGLYIYQYVPLLTGGTLAIPGESLWTIISYQLLPIMLIVGAVITYFNRKTGTVYTGAFAGALLVAWIVVASQATHVAM